jgi:hypothetical protein
MSADKDLLSVQQARDLVEAAHRAQAQVVQFDQAKIDRICDAMAKAALRESPRVAALAVEETGYGIAEDKRLRINSRLRSFGTPETARSGWFRNEGRSQIPARAASWRVLLRNPTSAIFNLIARSNRVMRPGARILRQRGASMRLSKRCAKLELKQVCRLTRSVA